MFLAHNKTALLTALFIGGMAISTAAMAQSLGFGTDNGNEVPVEVLADNGIE